MSNLLAGTILFFFAICSAVPRNPQSLSDPRGNKAPEQLTLSTINRQGGRVRPCGGFCSFRFCNTNGTFFELPSAPFTVLSSPKTATSPFICKGADNINQVIKTGEARVFSDGVYEPISRWRPDGLDTLYPENFIQTFEGSNFPYTSGIGRIEAKGNQWDFLHDRCMILPIGKYRENSIGQGKVLDTTGEANACIAFRTTAPELHVQLDWNSGDDFDLEVIEPDGDFLDFFNPRTEAGKLNGDNSMELCDSNLPGGKENILYFPGSPIEVGMYTATVKHFFNCSKEVETEWTLKVMKKGVVSLETKGKSSFGDNTVVATEIFSYPGVST